MISNLHIITYWTKLIVLLCTINVYMFILLNKSLFLANYPIYLKNMFTLRSTSYNLRGNYILTLPKPKITTCGLRSFSYHAANQWNSLPDYFRTANFNDFEKILAILDFMCI